MSAHLSVLLRRLSELLGPPAGYKSRRHITSCHSYSQVLVSNQLVTGCYYY